MKLESPASLPRDVADDVQAIRLIRDQVESSRGSIPFARLISPYLGAPDDFLARAIEADSEARARCLQMIDLMSYLEAVPGLERSPVALDAAIDATLRSMASGGPPQRAHVEALVHNYPHIAREIRNAADLSLACWLTNNTHEAQAAPVELLEPGSLFGEPQADGSLPFRLLRLIGQGATGLVYLAQHVRLSDDNAPALVAIKIVAPALPGASQAIMRRVADEAAKARRITHPNVVRVLDRGHAASGDHYLVLEYVSGGDLAAWRARNPRLVGTVGIELVRRVALGLQAAHAAGITHRDLKPGNVLLDVDGHPKVADFGTSARVQDLGFEVACTSGTPGFMSPEQYEGSEQAAAPPVDVFALGGLLYWMLTGLPTNGASADEVARTFTAHTLPRRIIPARIARRSTRDLQLIIDRATHRDPLLRHSSPAEFADDLQRWLDNRPIPWARTSLARRAGMFVSRHRFATAAVSLAAIAILALGAWGITKAAQARQEGEWRGRTRDMLDYYLEIPSGARKELTITSLASTWMTEWLYGPKVIDDPAGIPLILNSRAARFRGWIDSLTSSGLGDSYEAHYGRLALVVVLLRINELPEAIQLLDGPLADWSRTLAPGDPSVATIRLLRAAAHARILANDVDGTTQHPWSAGQVAHELEMAMAAVPTAMRNGAIETTHKRAREDLARAR